MLAWWIILQKYFFSMFCNADIAGAKKPCVNAAAPCENANKQSAELQHPINSVVVKL
jgi:hypothetical protein